MSIIYNSQITDSSNLSTKLSDLSSRLTVDPNLSLASPTGVTGYAAGPAGAIQVIFNNSQQFNNYKDAISVMNGMVERIFNGATGNYPYYNSARITRDATYGPTGINDFKNMYDSGSIWLTKNGDIFLKNQTSWKNIGLSGGSSASNGVIFSTSFNAGNVVSNNTYNTITTFPFDGTRVATKASFALTFSNANANTGHVRLVDQLSGGTYFQGDFNNPGNVIFQFSGTGFTGNLDTSRLLALQMTRDSGNAQTTLTLYSFVLN